MSDKCLVSLFPSLPSVYSFPPLVQSGTISLFFFLPAMPSNYRYGISDEIDSCFLTLIGYLWKGPTHSSQHRLRYISPSSLIEKCFAFQPNILAVFLNFSFIELVTLYFGLAPGLPFFQAPLETRCLWFLLSS